MLLVSNWFSYNLSKRILISANLRMACSSHVQVSGVGAFILRTTGRSQALPAKC